MRQADLFAVPDTHQALRFDGPAIETEDVPRLSSQLLEVKSRLLDGRWWTLRDLAREIGASEAGVSARIRDLRKARFGGYEVERRRLEGGLFEYRVKP